MRLAGKGGGAVLGIGVCNTGVDSPGLIPRRGGGFGGGPFGLLSDSGSLIIAERSCPTARSGRSRRGGIGGTPDLVNEADMGGSYAVEE